MALTSVPSGLAFVLNSVPSLSLLLHTTGESSRFRQRLLQAHQGLCYPKQGRERKRKLLPRVILHLLHSIPLFYK